LLSKYHVAAIEKQNPPMVPLATPPLCAISKERVSALVKVSVPLPVLIPETAPAAVSVIVDPAKFSRMVKTVLLPAPPAVPM